MKTFLLFFFMISSAFACELQGRFSQTVFDVLGRSWALEQTSYGLLIADKTGHIISEDYVGPDHVIYPASTIKTLIAVALLKSNLNLKQFITINQNNAKAECKYWDCHQYGFGKKQTVERLLWDMITVSNNIATNQLIDFVGKSRINKTAQELGLDLRVFRKVYDDVDPEPAITEKNRGTAHGFVKLYLEIATGAKKYLREDLRLKLVDILAHQKYNSSLNDKFPEGVLFYHKTGNTSKATGDAGFYFTDDKVVVLAGLQDFNRYRACHDDGKCFNRNGFWSLSEIGHRSFHLVESCLRE